MIRTLWNKFTAYIVLATLVVALGVVAYKASQALAVARHELTTTVARVKDLEAQQEALAAQIGRTAKAVQAEASRNHQRMETIQNELSKHKAWADAPVPAGVRDRLCERTRCRD